MSNCVCTKLSDMDPQNILLEEDGSVYCVKCHGGSESQSSPSTEEGSMDALMRDFGELGSTPPRTRILRRNMHRKHKDKRSSIHGAYKLAKFCHRSIMRYSTSVLGDHKESHGDNKRSKRHHSRRRHSGRDFKMDVDCVGEEEYHVEENGESHPTFKVESSNRFLSLSCKLVRAAGQWKRTVVGPDSPRGDRSRFYETLSNLVKPGTDKEKTCRRQLSKEEHMWQTELKDLIWLELQAWHAMRTPSEQDQYLYEARQAVPQLIIDINSFRFTKTNEQLSVQSGDSGIQLTPEVEDETEDPSTGSCQGCLWLFCPSCMEVENSALHQVEMLLSRLAFAESLYPSSRAFAYQNPDYASKEFVCRVKAMCSWYNITRHHRLKLLILCRQLLSNTDGNTLLRSSSTESELTSDGPGLDYYNTRPITTMGRYLSELDSDYSRNYRKFIEDVLKVKGLRKALYFLEKIHQTVLRKARIALEKPSHAEEEGSEVSECRRYGHWSGEARALNLPSFIPAFLFISRIPIDVIHEFLRMRLETKPEKPSALSIRQLTRELKEGLSLAVLNKERYLHHVDIALIEEDEATVEKFKQYIEQFDQTLSSVLKLYLDYLHQWVVLTQKEKLQKNLLEEEWKFILSTAPSVPHGRSMCGKAFCKIASLLLRQVQIDFSESVRTHIEIVTSPDPDSSIRQSVLVVSRGLQTVCQDIRDRTHRVIMLAKMLNKHLDKDVFCSCPAFSESVGDLKCEALKVCETIEEMIELVEGAAREAVAIEEVDKASVQSRFRELLHQFYKFGFEYCREIHRLLSAEARTVLVVDAARFSRRWLQFVSQYCEKGRGVRPRWANYGLEFLVWLFHPENCGVLPEDEFERLKQEVEGGIAHILGAASPTAVVSAGPAYLSTRTRSSSPRPPHAPPRHSISVSDSMMLNGEKPDSPELTKNSLGIVGTPTRQGRILKAVNKLDTSLDERRRQENRIGCLVETRHSDRGLVKPRPVTFTWQRGIKIGQGRFGKVYTAVNNDTGELMAMKEISMHPNDPRTIRSVANELRIIEGITHPNLVKYYGAEIHREELLIFMELCTEGTLDSLIESTEAGLSEGLVRRYTSQLVAGIGALHQHSIVHRDIKPANIFLTAEGNCLKIGDFGSAVKIKAHTTVPGELKGFVGTQAYMAPEVFMRSEGEGHGRAADIWSLGCVVIEMTSGKRPWHEFDSHFQIMFKVGMGEIPEVPDSLSEEGREFVYMCLQHQPRQRATTAQLQQHTFVKGDMEEESVSFVSYRGLEEYLKLGIKR